MSTSAPGALPERNDRQVIASLVHEWMNDEDGVAYNFDLADSLLEAGFMKVARSDDLVRIHEAKKLLQHYVEIGGSNEHVRKALTLLESC